MQKSDDEQEGDLRRIWLRKLTREPYDLEYWLSKTPQERWEAGELLRQHLYGYDPATARMERTLEVVQQPWLQLTEAEIPSQSKDLDRELGAVEGRGTP